MIRAPSLRSLDLFVILMRTRSISETARHIGITQPAASLALKELEAQIGLPLFVRTRQRLVPTPQATALLPQVDRLIGQADVVQQQIVALQEAAAPTLRLACIPSFGSTLLPPILARFRRSWTRVQLKIEVQPLGRVLDLLRQEAIDLAFCYLPGAESSPTDHRQERLLVTPLAGLMASDHPLAAKPILTLEDLSEHTAIIADRNNLPIPAAVSEAVLENGHAKGVLEVNNVYTAIGLARAGIGIALANPLLLSDGTVPGLTARPIKPEFPLALGALRGLPHANTPEVEALIAYAQDAARHASAQLSAQGLFSGAEFSASIMTAS
ncbi:LysR family transcriptional regulator [Roseomonas marmotae]|uniref:LysR family transcriptional regulator n=1 Tax=Roseomonas marmotae TaxID=2768161 RepID=A0ABS3KI81_9PROT|nr:LysR family transcriptional regulator [Roseomonas marmotae]MBO1077176.1 LysR family transcriptional regulator [Roseomonas marmotae]QTI82043.1 LysR family transcriptional regulator [Roseomonas marmotae]